MEKTYKFILPQNKEVEKINIRIENDEVFVDVEFKEKFQPKDGDFLMDGCGDVFVYNGKVTEENYGCHIGDAGVGIWTHSSDKWVPMQSCRFATPEEKAAFLERLEKECGKRWNAEKKQLEDIRWEPKHGNTYWYVNEELKAEEEVYSERYNFDMCNVRINNCFRTPEAAQIVADQIKEIFKNSKAE